jgi:hypothetical protein
VTIPLVVGIDGSESSPEAVDWPAAEAARHSPSLPLVHTAAGDDEPSDVISAASERARVENPTVQLSSKVLHEDATAALGQPGRGLPLPGAPNTAGCRVGRGPAGRPRTQKKGAPGLRLGLINHALLHHAPHPGAVVPQT